jgi:membrane protease subunit (stomatin/prohibitin family)
VIAGTATSVSNRVSRRQEGRWAQQEQRQLDQEQQRMSAQAPEQEPDPTEELQKLAQLHESGVLTDEEFAAAKAKVLHI